MTVGSAEMRKDSPFQKFTRGVDVLSVWVNKVSIILVIAAGIGMCFTLLAATFSRYIFDQAFLWTDEVGRMLMIFFAFIGSSVAYAKNDLTNMDLFRKLLPPLGKQLLSILITLLCLAFFSIFAYYMYLSLPLYAKTAVVITKVPQNVPAMGMIYGCAACLVHGLSHLLHQLDSLAADITRRPQM